MSGVQMPASDATNSPQGAAAAAAAAAAGSAPTVPQRIALYVGDLAPTVNERTLHQMFSQVAPVQNVRVIRHAITRQSLGYAYVNMHSTADAERCIEMLNYSSLEGRPCRIMFSNRDPSSRRSGKGNLFIKGLPPAFNSKDLHDFFQGYGFGEVASCKVALDEEGKSKCYGFVQFRDDDNADKAIEETNGLQLEDHEITVMRYRSKAERGAATAWNNVFVKNIPKDIDEDALRTMFEVHGAVSNAVVMLDGDGKSKGFGFVCFVEGKAARKAVRALHGALLRDPEVPDAEVASEEELAAYSKASEAALESFRRELEAIDDPEVAAQLEAERKARAKGEAVAVAAADESRQGQQEAKAGPEEDEEAAAGGSGGRKNGPRKGTRPRRPMVTAAAAAATVGVPPDDAGARPPKGYKRVYAGRAIKAADRVR